MRTGGQSTGNQGHFWLLFKTNGVVGHPARGLFDKLSAGGDPRPWWRYHPIVSGLLPGCAAPHRSSGPALSRLLRLRRGAGRIAGEESWPSRLSIGCAPPQGIRLGGALGRRHLVQRGRRHCLLTRSKPRRQEERAIRRRPRRGLAAALRKPQAQVRQGGVRDRGKILRRVGRLQGRYPEARGFVSVAVTQQGPPTLTDAWEAARFRAAAAADGA